MELTFSLIKKVLQTLALLTELISYIVTISIRKPKSPHFIEYTHLCRGIIDLYILLILLLFLVHTMNPKLICNFLSKKIGFITSDKCKILISFLIAVSFFSANNKPQLVFGMIIFVSSLALYVIEFIFNCDTFKQKESEGLSENYETTVNINNSNIILTKSRPDSDMTSSMHSLA